MKNNRVLLLIFFIFSLKNGFAQTKAATLNALEKQISISNDEMKYDRSLELITNFLEDKNATPYDRYFAWLLKSYTHKRLFDYEQALISLDSAAVEGMRSSRKQETTASIKLEKASIYFDTQQYEKAEQLMRELKLSNYKYISAGEQSVIIMQLGYIAFLANNFKMAETNYDEAIEIMLKNSERNLPMIYGKKVELYGKMHLPSKRDQALALGLQFAEKYHILKYKMYMYETLYKQFVKNGEYKEAYFADRKLDSLTFIYNAEETKFNLELNDKKLELVKQENKLKQKNYVLWFMICIVSCLILIIGLIYYLLLSRKKAHQLLEADYKRIFDELYLLTTTSEKNNSLYDLSKFELSERQLEVIALLKLGKSNKEIASALFISENTVKYHLKSIYDILKIESRKELYKPTI